MLLQNLGYFVAFMAIVAIVFYFVKNEFKHWVLFGSSLILISLVSWQVGLFALLFGTINYYFGLILEKNRKVDKIRLRIFWTAIFFDIGFLAFFKYFDLLFGSVKFISELINPGSITTNYSLIVPIGISYYTFQALGYIIRINRGSEKAERDYFRFITYLTFFPKFFSGPVERSNRFLPQLTNLSGFKKENLEDGVRLFLWGAFKKIVIAYNLYWPVNEVYSNIGAYSGWQLLLVYFVQTLYIYMEFSGYTDMALGAAKVLGINLVDNFNRPFLARNISEFWRRWHISLSSWCNDFIYSPFIVKYRKYENFAIVGGVFLTFFTIGIWHEANWTFIALGLLQAIAIVYEYYTKKARLQIASKYSKPLVNAVSRILVFLFVSLSMVFFFSHTISDSWYLLSNMFSSGKNGTEMLTFTSHGIEFFLAILAFIIIFVAEMITEKGKSVIKIFLEQPIWIKYSGYALLVLAILFAGSEWVPIEYMRF